MSKLRDELQSQKGRGALNSMKGTKDGIDRLHIVRIDLLAKLCSFGALNVFAALGDEIPE